ncbi:Ankyrin repeat-containing domain, partial [Trinorchestia longiramus]
MQLARDGDSAVLALAISRLGEQRRGRINQLDSNRLSPLHYAARYSHSPAITALLQAGALVNIRGQDDLTPLHCAARYRKSIKSSRGRRPSQPPEKMAAVETEDGEHDNLLVDSQLTVRSVSSMGDGVRFGKPSDDSVVRLLVENGADVNAVDVYDLTPLHYACMRGNDVAIRDLLSYPQVNIE